MECFRYYKNNDHSEWKFDCMSLARKLAVQRKLREVMRQLKQSNYEDYSKYFSIHKRKGFEIHQLILE